METTFDRGDMRRTVMRYKIIGDSCLDLTAELKNDPRFQIIPLTLQVDDHMVIDDETFNQKKFLELVKASPNCPKTACPSPEAFRDAYGSDAEWIFVITLSSHLSGTYNSAVLGQSLYEEENGAKHILVIDSESASSGELNIAFKLMELCEQDLTFEQVSEQILKFRDEQKTYFILESLDTLRKNGRLTGLQAFFATALNIKPVMGAQKGIIVKLEQARGIGKGLARMCDLAVKDASNAVSGKRVVIAHCNNPDRARATKAELEKRASFKEIIITETAGVATVYANDGGIILGVG